MIETPPSMAKHLQRPRDPLALAKLIGDIATGQVEDSADESPKVSRARTAGRKGGPARATALTPEQRAEIARNAARARWGKKGTD